MYNTNGGSGALQASDFALSISGGTATLSSATPTSISASGNTYTLGIGISGSATGKEHLSVTVNANSVYDAQGNAASTTQETSSTELNKVYLNDVAAPVIAATPLVYSVPCADVAENLNGCVEPRVLSEVSKV